MSGLWQQCNVKDVNENLEKGEEDFCFVLAFVLGFFGYTVKYKEELEREFVQWKILYNVTCKT